MGLFSNAFKRSILSVDDFVTRKLTEGIVENSIFARLG